MITCRDQGKAYRVRMTLAEMKRYDNGALVSCGLDYLPDTVAHKAIEITSEEANHSGCLSRCKLRGDNLCQW